MKEHHIGIIVRNIKKSQKVFEKIGYITCSELIEDVYQNNRILFLENSDSLQKIELIEAMNSDSTIKNFEYGFHHICYEIDTIENFVEVFRHLKVGKIFSKEFIAPALDNRKIIFGCLNNGMFVEFVEKG